MSELFSLTASTLHRESMNFQIELRIHHFEKRDIRKKAPIISLSGTYNRGLVGQNLVHNGTSTKNKMNAITLYIIKWDESIVFTRK